MRIVFLFTLIILTINNYTVQAQETIEIDGSGLPIAHVISNVELPLTPKKASKYAGMSGITCRDNLFWASNQNGNILEFQLDGNDVTFIDTVVSSTIYIAAGSSIAFANNITGNSFSPTFFSSSGDLNSTRSYYFNGSSWVAVGDSSSCKLYNSAAYNNNLYYQYNGNTPYCINKFNGTSFTEIFSSDSLRFSVADFAVDEDGNLWTFAENLPNSSFTKFVLIISPDGQIIKQYPFTFNSLNAYGCFLLNDKLYIGLGANNPVYPNSLLPLSFTQDSVIVGSPIAMSISNLSDLASCSPGIPAAIKDDANNSFNFIIAPNPTENYINCSFKNVIGTIEIEIINKEGQLLNKTFTNQENNKIDISNLPSGIYIIRAKSKQQIQTKKLVKY
jgi:hypothetical protein